jgi:undecaprenyl diphosphate synthase
MNDATHSAIPHHVGLILDGNRRWAKARGLKPIDGHKQGYQSLKAVGKAGLKRGIKVVTAFVFSTENWQRSKEEVAGLMKLVLWVAKNEIEELHADNIRVRFLGSKEHLAKNIIKAIEKAEQKTLHNTGGTLALCFNYGGYQEIADATKAIIEAGVPIDDVTPEVIEKYLYAPDIPPIDLIVRTSGEQRLSNFMLWRAAYSELYFTNVHWPDFDEAELDKALTEYASRQRRFGK